MDAIPRPTASSGARLAFGLGAVATVIVAWPVVVSPTRAIFGREIVGRHHDPFTVMRQMAGDGAAGPYVQPLTDWVGWLLARVMDPVAAYNTLVLLSLPFSTATSYALARYLGLGHGPALLAGLAFAFAPLHLAHAAYHVHIAQTQWIPLYLLALCAMVDRPSWRRGFGLVAAAAALALSNFYGGLLGAVISPFALVAYWWTSPRAGRAPEALWRPAAVLAGIAVIGLGTIAWRYPMLRTAESPFAFPIADVGRYSARWWSYFVPPVDHAVLGAGARDIFVRTEIGPALVEQQVFVSYTLLLLALAATAAAVARWRQEPQLRPIVAFVVVALVAAVVSVGPASGSCAPGSVAPACWLHGALPMFRAYSRFAVLTHLGIALAAAAGTALLARSRAGAVLAVVCVALAGFEYWPLPARARDVLPTQGHRWLADRWPEQRTLDCVRPTRAEAEVAWLMRRRLTNLNLSVETCGDPNLGSKLAALGYTHVVERRSPIAGAVPDPPLTSGLSVLAEFPDSRVYAVVAQAPDIVALRVEGFHEFESHGQDRWQWMGPAGRWQVRNTTSQQRLVALEVDLESVESPRTLEVSIDGAPVETLSIGVQSATYRLGPWRLARGDHALGFRTVEPPFRPSEHGATVDQRLLTIAFRNIRWVEHAPSR